MVQMIPPVIPKECRSVGEKEIFARLQVDPGADGWIVLHSLDVSRHIRQVAGEIDFLIVIPDKGVLCLEVKACRELHRQGGLWYYGPLSSSTGDPRGPFRQVSESMHSVREHVVKRAPGLANVVFWSGVIFPYIPFTVVSEEWHEWQVIDSRLFGSQSIAALVTAILDRARAHLAKTQTATWFDPQSPCPTPMQAETLVKILRPNFEFYQSPKARLQQRDEEVIRYTEEQFGALDSMGANPRVLYEGPAGTGKTILAIEAARRASAEGRRVLFLCFNRLLGRKLQSECASLELVKTCTLHRHMLDVTEREGPDSGAGPSFWEEELPDQAISWLLGSPETPAFDELVVDEAQDVIREQYLDFLDLTINGGLASGRWKFFGDFERQAIYASGSCGFQEELGKRARGLARYSLRENCRNTPRIAELAQLLGGMSPPYRRVLRPDDGVEPTIKYYADESDQSQMLLSSLEELYADGFTQRDIALLSARSQMSCAAGIKHPVWKNRLRPMGTEADQGIGYCSIHAFKGLESRAVVVTDIERIGDVNSQALFYVASTRALHRLIILAHQSARNEARALVIKRLA